MFFFKNHTCNLARYRKGGVFGVSAVLQHALDGCQAPHPTGTTTLLSAKSCLSSHILLPRSLTSLLLFSPTLGPGGGLWGGQNGKKNGFYEDFF